MFDAIKKLFNNNNNITIVRTLGDIKSNTITYKLMNDDLRYTV